jgi:hypothetical protein
MRNFTSAALLTVILAFLFHAWPAGAETLLLAISETVDGSPSPPPPPATEGIFDGLFEAGHIVFDLGDGAKIPEANDLAAMARSGGAGYVVQAAVVFTLAHRDGFTDITATARINLFGAQKAESLGSETLEDSNQGREKDVDLKKLGFELGTMIAARVNEMLAGRPRSGF